VCCKHTVYYDFLLLMRSCTAVWSSLSCVTQCVAQTQRAVRRCWLTPPVMLQHRLAREKSPQCVVIMVKSGQAGSMHCSSATAAALLITQH
jgi:hypothetical protein